MIVALLAIAIGVVGWFRPVQHDYRPPTPSYTEQQISDAKAKTCGAFNIAKNEVSENTHKPYPEGDELGTLTVATDGRLALLAASDYLLSNLAADSAVPTELAGSVRSLASSYQEFAIRALNGEASSALDPLRQHIDSDIASIDQMCK